MKFAIKKWDKVEVEWLDSHQIHGWTALSSGGLDCERSLGHCSIGYYVGQTSKQFTIVQSRKSDQEFIANEDTMVNSILTIPKCAITKLVKLK